MTASGARPAARIRLRATAERIGLRAVVLLATPVGLTVTVFVVALALRLVYLDRAWDIFVDEITYLAIARNIAEGRGLTLYGHPFFLHPPAFLVLEALVTSATGLPSHPVDAVQAVRTLNVVLAGFAASAMFLLVRQVAGTPGGLLAAILFGIDAFVIRMNSRNYIETSALLWVVLGYLVLLGGRRDLDALLSRRAFGAGAFFGLALLSKDMTFFLTIAPLGLAFLWGRVIPRSRAIVTGLGAAATYAIYPVGVALSGHGEELAAQKLRGLFRFLGLVQETGFNTQGGPSFLGAVIANLGTLGTTYAMIVLGFFAGLILIRWGSGGAGSLRRARMIGLWGLAAYATVIYSVALGTLEEQFFYFLMVPAVASVSTATIAVWTSRDRWSRRLAGPARAPALAKGTRLAVAVALGAFLAWSLTAWTVLHFRPDDSYEEVARWLHSNAPRASVLGVTDEPGKFLYRGYEIHAVATGEDVLAKHVQYVLISSKQVRAGYTPGGEKLLAWLEQHGSLVFVADGATYERMELWEVPPPSPPPTAPDVPLPSPMPGGDLPWVLVPTLLLGAGTLVWLVRLERADLERQWVKEVAPVGAQRSRRSRRRASGPNPEPVGPSASPPEQLTHATQIGIAASAILVAAVTAALVATILPTGVRPTVGEPKEAPTATAPVGDTVPSPASSQ